MAFDFKEYYIKHRGEMLASGKEWRQHHKVEVIQYNREYYQMHKTEILLGVKNYKQAHKVEILQYAKEYGAKHKIERLPYIREYSQTHKLEKQRYDKEYRQTERGKVLRNKHRTKRRRMLGYNPLNSWFKNSHAHHINDIDVIYIPAGIHNQFIASTTQKHRDLIMRYYGSVGNMITTSELS